MSNTNEAITAEWEQFWLKKRGQQTNRKTNKRSKKQRKTGKIKKYKKIYINIHYMAPILHTKTMISGEIIQTGNTPIQ